MKQNIPLISKKVDISEEKLLKMTRNAYDRSGADNYCEAKTLHLLSRAISHSKKPELATLQPNIRVKAESDAWKQAFILAISFLKKYQMELALRTVIVEVPKSFSISTKKFSSPDSVTRVFNDIMKTKNNILDKTFEDKLNDFIEEMEMEDFWQKNPITVTVRQPGSKIENSTLTGNA
ncbi:hypothetical protein TRFO_00897 [Tritrichomonas foetus]|uniref:Uncharacterized protein n=1 Tax=Tritrichomonas foetus TaxID=1144522 RepID=A0A1J4L6J7_9EUKA|nr:hypothetical protein TRFO_00897 [Tritrichomonas foetus]|eukprot:OHT17628.1 hypothetical protein TRFO_00897 [Tritrichomonas foetus]